MAKATTQSTKQQRLSYENRGLKLALMAMLLGYGEWEDGMMIISKDIAMEIGTRGLTLNTTESEDGAQIILKVT